MRGYLRVGTVSRLCLRNDSWDGLQDLLSDKASDRWTAKDNRLFFEAVLWIVCTGAPWRDLPDKFGPWNSVCRRLPPRSDRQSSRRYDPHLCKDSNLVERFFNQLEQFRRIATRYDSLPTATPPSLPWSVLGSGWSKCQHALTNELCSRQS